MSAKPLPSPGPAVDVGPVDVLVLTALQDELEAVLALGEGGRAGWQERRDLGGFRYYRRAFPARAGARSRRGGVERRDGRARGGDPRPAARRGAGSRVPGDVRDLRGVPREGRARRRDRGRPALRLRRGQGRRRAREDGRRCCHSLRTFDLEATWKMDAAYLARELDLVGALAARVRPRRRRSGGGCCTRSSRTRPRAGRRRRRHPDARGACPGWTERLQEARRRPGSWR